VVFGAFSALVYRVSVLFLGLVSASFGADYYLSNEGNDENSGVSPDEAWQTIDQLNDVVLGPGDVVHFRAGDTWRGPMLTVNQSGELGNPILFTSYGEGEKPRLLGSLRESLWIRTENSNIWESAGEYSATSRAAQIFLRSVEGNIIWGDFTFSDDMSDLNGNLKWLFANNKVYVYYSGDLNEDFEYVEIPQLANAVQINHQDYLAFRNLEIAYTTLSGIRDAYPPLNQKGLEVRNSHIHHIGYKGSDAAYGIYVSHSDAYYGYNEIHDCGRRSLSLSILDGNFGNGKMSNVVIENNHFHHGWHTTGLDMIIGSGDRVDSVVVRNNFFEGSLAIDLSNGLNAENSNHIFISNKAGGTEGDSAYIGNVYIYNNIFTHLHGKAIAFEWVEDTYIYNNTFYGLNPTIPNYQSVISLSRTSRNIDIKNNIIYNNDPRNTGRGLNNIFIASDAFYEGIELDYNLYFTSDPGTSHITFGESNVGGPSVSPDQYHMDDWDSYRQAHPEFDANSMVQENPGFLNPDANDFSLLESSPARGRGVAVDWIREDYNGNAINSPPDLGAVQFYQGVDVLKKKKEFSHFIEIQRTRVSVISSEKQVLSIFRMDGKKIFHFLFQGRASFDFSFLQKGIYYLKIENEIKKLEVF
jgi:hypothetical protein